MSEATCQPPMCEIPLYLSSEEKVLEALRKRYPDQQYAFVDHLAFQDRTIDAMVKCLWRSDGYELHAFEIKCSRSDWLTELKKPQKSAAIANFCDRFWLVVNSKDVVKDIDELPATWGLLEWDGKKFYTRKKAIHQAPHAITSEFFGAWARAVNKADPGKARVTAAYREAMNEGRLAGRRDGAHELKKANEKLDRLEEAARLFKEASGLDMDADSWSAGQIGEAVKALMGGGLGRFDNMVTHLKAMQHNAEIVQRIAGFHMDAYKELLTCIKDPQLPPIAPKAIRWVEGS